jgi:hypothetical protein
MISLLRLPTSAVAGALFSSLIIYLFYRSELCLVNVWVDNILPSTSFTTVRSAFQSALPLPDFVVYQIPGGLWVFAATLASGSGTLRIFNSRLSFGLFPLLAALGIELFQAVDLTDGTPDPGDVIAAIAGYLMALWVAGRSRREDSDLEGPLDHYSGVACVACHLSLFLADIHS